jgi:hypothetical protein
MRWWQRECSSEGDGDGAISIRGYWGAGAGEDCRSIEWGRWGTDDGWGRRGRSCRRRRCAERGQRGMAVGAHDEEEIDTEKDARNEEDAGSRIHPIMRRVTRCAIVRPNLNVQYGPAQTLAQFQHNLFFFFLAKEFDHV